MKLSDPDHLIDCCVISEAVSLKLAFVEKEVAVFRSANCQLSNFA